ncbi:GMC family oxidoreductase [Pseudomonas sp. Root562]|uniref:GMC family oxidoreductase n=1 Tax=Pseudomonas sp. Root562 TaxID=1736561 RepID=UPI000702D8E2|nr:GMC family oxidoreductase N-terminal domain-containing protein [Pseudomonas sp. Root562]KQZ83711.1 alanine-phosphoribitol ligase [Pseudomonas sp. Root562]
MRYDFIIIGGGSAGCVLANRLSANPSNKVLLLEAGGGDRHPLFRMPAGFAKMTKGRGSWGWSTVPQKHLKNRVLRYTQAKVIGGGSSINAQIYTRGAAADYDEWASECGAEGWAYKDVLPYFKRAENNQRYANQYHGYQGPLGVSNPISPLPICEAFFQAGQEMGIPYNPDFNGAAQDGLGYYQLTQLNAKRSSTSAAYLRPAMGRSNLTVMLGAFTRRVIIKDKRAIGVEVVPKGASESTPYYADREVIVSSGAIGSPKLLMQSGIGPADHLSEVGIPLEHALPGVGSNLQDHLDLFAIAECTGNHTYDPYGKPHMAAWAGLQYLLLKKGPVASSLFETGGFWYADSQARSPDIQFHLGLGSGIEAGVAQMRNPGVTLNSAFLRPRSRGTVRLASANPADAPLIDPNYFSDPYDREMSIKGLRLARQILAQPALQRFVLAERLPGLDMLSDEQLFEYACANAKTDHHPAGTCRMGNGEDAVVSTELKVHGIDRLRVVDASIMPRLNSSNTNAPTIMIAEKAADLILGKVPQSEEKSHEYSAAHA